MQHTGTQVIETARLILRPFVTEDASAMFHNWANDPEVTRFLTWPPHGNVSVTESLLHTWITSYAEKNHYLWAIVLKELNEPIGNIAVVNFDAAPDIPEIGYCLGRAWWHQGYMTEALSAVIRTLLTVNGCAAVTAKHDVDNPNSGGVMRKSGMRMTGVTHGVPNNQGECDAAVYTITRDEYKSLHQGE